MIRFSAPRAILDWYRRPRGLSNADPADASAQRQRASVEDVKPLIGVVGMTRHRLTIELRDQRIASAFGKVLADALADPALHESKRDAILATQRQLDALLSEKGWTR